MLTALASRGNEEFSRRFVCKTGIVADDEFPTSCPLQIGTQLAAENKTFLSACNLVAWFPHLIPCSDSVS